MLNLAEQDDDCHLPQSIKIALRYYTQVSQECLIAMLRSLGT